jgi:hypothetical protein
MAPVDGTSRTLAGLLRVKEMPMTRKTQQDAVAKHKDAEVSKPTVNRAPTDQDQLEKRIERLEQRLDESILGDDGLAAVEQGVDRNPSGDTLQRAVRRSNVKRGSRKA